MAELVDNALDARRDGAVRVRVDYDHREGWIQVSDDGAGMSRRELAEALVLGLSEKSGEQIGRFGLGMKTAATALGSRFTVATVRPGGTYEWVADYDEEAFLRAGNWELPLRRRAKRRDTGTMIQIWSERVYARLDQSLHRNLGWTFRHFLLDGVLDLTVNERPVAASGYEVDSGSVLPFEGTVDGREVRGWAGLLTKSSQRGWYGFSLVRHRRIVRRHEKLGFQPHPSTARVVGELHLDDFDTNNLKTDFIRETPAWRELERWVSSTVEPVLVASRRLAHAGMLDLRVRAQIDEQRLRIVGSEDADEFLRIAGSGEAAPVALDESPVSVAVGSLHLEHRWVRGSHDDDYFESDRKVRTGESDLVSVRSNLAHPLAERAGSLAFWACHNIAEAAARNLAPTDQFVAFKGVILRGLLDQRDLLRALSRPRSEATPV